MRLIPALRYQLDYMAKTSMVALGIMMTFFIVFGMFAIFSNEIPVVINLMGVINIGGEAYVIINFGVVLITMVFITGIAAIREDMKFFLQHGIGRYTTYFSTLFCGMIYGIAMGLLCQIFSLAAGLWPAFSATGLRFSAGGFFGGWILHAVCFPFAWQFGTLISLIYYRLSKIMTIVFSLAAGSALVFALPAILSRISDERRAAPALALSSIAANPFSLACFILLAGALVAAINFLLLRRAQAKE
jgi:hypothetical protein